MVTLYTSVHPGIKRALAGDEVGHRYQAECLKSWKDAGFNIVSLNNQSEIHLLAELYPDIAFLAVPTDRPKIFDFILAIREACQCVTGIINADCIFVGSAADAKGISEAAKASLVLLERINIDPAKLLATGKGCYGFDAFIFNAENIKNLDLDRNICIGETWWDYIFPLSYLKNGGLIRKPNSSLLLHLDHSIAWSDTQYFKNGRAVYESYGAFIAGRKKIEWSDDNMEESVGQFSYNCFNFIHTESETLSSDGIRENLMSGVRASIPHFGAELEEKRDEIIRLRSHILNMSKVENASYFHRILYLAYRRFGEFLCTVSTRFLRYQITKTLARSVYSLGDKFQSKAAQIKNPDIVRLLGRGTSS